MKSVKALIALVVISILVVMMFSKMLKENEHTGSRFTDFKRETFNDRPEDSTRQMSSPMSAQEATAIQSMPTTPIKATAIQSMPTSPIKATAIGSEPTTPVKGSYPAWFSKAWSRSPTQKKPQPFVGDGEFFPACSSKKHKGGRSSDRYPFIEPKQYLPSVKNPCWYKNPTGKQGLCCSPYFYIAGVAKCGTTDLYRRLRMHPQIMKGTMKEYHFWDRERFGRLDLTADGEILDVNTRPWTFHEYLQKITGDDIRLVDKDIKNHESSVRIFGDGSPSYLWSVLNWPLLEGNEGCKEPRFVIGQHIYHFNPKSKIILIFRHPTPRLYSRFLSRIWRTPFLKEATSETFHNYVKKGVAMYRDCFDRWSLRSCAYNNTLHEEAVVRLMEGMYPVFMADWLRIWPRDQMLILRSEDYRADLNRTLERTFDFLGVDKLTGEAYDTVMSWKLVNVGTEYENLGPMKNETVQILDRFYQPFVEQLAELLQDRRFLWKDTYTPSLQ